MKRLISLALSAIMVLSLCSCGEHIRESPPGKRVETEPEVTAEDLLSTGVGVEDCESITLGVLIEITETDGFSGHLGGIFEETPEYLHLGVDEIDNRNVGEAQYFDLYFDKSSGVVYSSEPDGWARFDYDMDVSGLTDVAAIDLIEHPIMRELTYGYEVTGYTISGVVPELVKFMFGNMDMTGASIFTKFIYDTSKVLTDMHWDAENASGRFSIDAKISGVNSTVIKLPFNPNDIVDDSEALEPMSVDCAEDEVLLVEEFFGVDYVREPEFRDYLGEKYGDLHEGVLFLTRYYYNSYSREGFIRIVSTTKPTIEEELSAVVLLCEFAGIPFDCLWENGFMTEEEVMNIRDSLIGK